MNNIKQAFKNLPRRGQHNLVKILCLGIGFALVSVLVAKLCYERDFDTCYPDADRIYRISEKFERASDGEIVSGNTSGGVAPKLKQHLPQIELATRINPFSTDDEITVGDGVRLKASVYVVDSCFFKVFPTRILEGNADDVLAKPLYCLVSRTMAERMGGDVVGKRLKSARVQGLTMTVGAVYEDFPWNSSFHNYDVMLSMATQYYVGMEGQDYLVGNDRYSSFVKVAEGSHPERGDFDESVGRLIDEVMAAMQVDNMKYTLFFTPISDYHFDNSDAKQMWWILLILAVVVLVASVLNYVLIVMGNIVTRSREMAVRKCYGAVPRRIFGITCAEGLVHVALAVALAGVLIFVCKGTIERLLSAPVSGLFTNRGAWLVAALLLVVYVFSTVLPARLYNAVPVSTAFRGFGKNRRAWKLALLAVQFAFTGFMVSLLLVVNGQYSKLVNFDMGYDYDRLALINVDGIKGADRRAMTTELNKMAELEGWTPVTYPMAYQRSGNNVIDPDTKSEMFNASDLYNVGGNFFDVMGIKIVQGRGFSAHGDSLREMMVDRLFVKKLAAVKGWSDVIGRKVLVSEHSQTDIDVFTIVGVYDDFKTNSALDDDSRPTMMFHTDAYGIYAMEYLLKFHSLDERSMASVQQRLQRLYPNTTIIVDSYRRLLNANYDGVKNFRSAVLVAGLCALFITLLGLVGYVADETNRRRKEIAIRKVNGARTRDILGLLLADICKMAVPAVVAGSVAARVVAARWLEAFSTKTSLSLWLFLVADIVVLAIIAATVLLNSYRTANGNPADYLKNE